MNLERKITFRLEGSRFDELDDLARREGFTVSMIVRHVVCRFLEQERRLKVDHITLSATSAKAHPLPDRFQALYGQISGLDTLFLYLVC